MAEYIPIDLWAETKHPKLLENIRAHMDIYEMSKGHQLSTEETYVFIRQLMMYIRQEFEG